MSKRKRSRSGKRPTSGRRLARRRPPRQPTPVTYPSPAERERITERRDKLLRELIKIFVSPQDDDRKINKLVRRYGAQEVILVMDTFQNKALSAELIGDEASVYRLYRRAFARFGGDRSFLSAQEYSDLSYEHGKLNAKRTMMSAIIRKPSAREREWRDLLLVGSTYWEDITPPAVPPRPPDFDAPSSGEYNSPVEQLLEWGWDLEERRPDALANARKARSTSKWRPAIDDLVRMALDEGLLNGWPGEAASWASYHALSMLGHLRAYQVADQLFPLFEQENDWLSDRLAVTWSQMGPQAEPVLWDYLDDDQRNADWRSVAMLGLMKISQANPRRRSDIVNKFARLLRQATADDAEANAYLVHVLDRMEAVEAADVVSEAFGQDKVDTRIVQPYDLDLLQD